MMFDKNLLKLPNFKYEGELLAGYSILQAVLIIGQACFLSAAITGLWNGGSLSSHAWQICLFFVCYVGRQIVLYLKNSQLDRYSYTISREMREKLLKTIFTLGPSLVNKQGTGRIVTLALEGIHQIEVYLQLVLSKTLGMMIIPFLVFIAVLIIDWRSAIILFLVFPLIIIFMILLGKAAKSKADKQFQVFQLLSNYFTDSLRGIDTLKMFGLSKEYAKSIYETSETFRKRTMSTLKIAILSTFALDFFTTLSIAIVAVYLGLRLINGQLTLFPALTVLILAPEYFLPIREFANDYHATLDGKNAFQAVQDVIELDSVDSDSSNVNIPTWNNNSNLQISNLTLNYNDANDKSALSEINFNWTGIGKIGIVGTSGSGKSTFINFLNGFLSPAYDSGVEIKVNGQKIDSLSQQAWQEQVIYIPQNPYIFHDTLRENIRFYVPDSSDKQIMIAIEKAGLLSLVDSLPDGLDTIIGEKGRQFSGGESQRIAIARAFLDTKRQIIMFDEPTAHLDIETEASLKEVMLNMMENKLVFFATHRLHWLADFDKVIILENGKSIAFDKPENLRKQLKVIFPENKSQFEVIN